MGPRPGIDVADRNRHAVVMAAFVGASALVAIAVAAQLREDTDAWLIATDIAVGLAFMTAAVVSHGPVAERALVASVGALWLVGSALPEARLTHQTALVVGLLAFPSGRPRGTVRWVLIAGAVPIALGTVPQAGIAAIFALVAVATSRDSTSGRYPTLSAIGIAVVLAGSWWVNRAFRAEVDPVIPLIVYEVVLVLVAMAFVPGSAAVVAGRARLADRLLGDDVPSGMVGLQLVMRRVLQDPTVRIRTGQEVSGDRGSRKVLLVTDGGPLVATVEYSTSVLDEPAVAESVSTAVRVAARRERLEAQERTQLVRLEEARARLLTATDDQRQLMARQLLDDVVTPLRDAIATIEPCREGGETDHSNEAIDVVLGELRSAEDEVINLVAGIPPVPLGDGRLTAAVESLAKRSPVPVTVTSSSVAGDVATETALFYIVSEALTNSVKHAAARSISIDLQADDEQIVLAVADDGEGGADVLGAGIQGLVDRAAARGGRLRVESPLGAGTTITAAIPRRRSAATAR